jgi:hypothetical protein
MQNASVLVASMAVLKPPQKTMPMATPISRTQRVALRVREGAWWWCRTWRAPFGVVCSAGAGASPRISSAALEDVLDQRHGAGLRAWHWVQK